MRTGRYRVRPGLWGKAILQEEYDSPSFIAGHVDASVRVLRWADVQFEDLAEIQFRAYSHSQYCSKESP